MRDSGVTDTRFRQLRSSSMSLFSLPTFFSIFVGVFNFLKKILLCVLLEAIYGDLTAAVTGSVESENATLNLTAHYFETARFKLQDSPGCDGLSEERKILKLLIIVMK